MGTPQPKRLRGSRKRCKNSPAQASFLYPNNRGKIFLSRPALPDLRSTFRSVRKNNRPLVARFSPRESWGCSHFLMKRGAHKQDDSGTMKGKPARAKRPSAVGLDEFLEQRRGSFEEVLPGGLDDPFRKKRNPPNHMLLQEILPQGQKR